MAKVTGMPSRDEHLPPLLFLGVLAAASCAGQPAPSQVAAPPSAKGPKTMPRTRPASTGGVMVAPSSGKATGVGPIHLGMAKTALVALPGIVIGMSEWAWILGGFTAVLSPDQRVCMIWVTEPDTDFWGVHPGEPLRAWQARLGPGIQTNTPVGPVTLYPDLDVLLETSPRAVVVRVQVGSCACDTWDCQKPAG